MKRVVGCFVFFMLVATSAYALGISPASVAFDFEPGLRQNITLRVDNQQDATTLYSISFEGDLKEYLTLHGANSTISIPGLSSASITIGVVLPESLEKAGHRTAAIAVTETQPSPGAVAVLTGIKVLLSVYVPYPGKYAEVVLKVPDIEKEEKPGFTVQVKNKGAEIINEFITYIEVYDLGALVERIPSKRFSLKQQESEAVLIRSPKRYNPGEYAVIGFGEYDGRKTPKESGTLKVGTLFINITDYTKVLEQNKVNKVMIAVKNLWNHEVSSLSATLKMKGNDDSIKDEVQTATISLQPWEEGSIITFLDATNLTEGNYMLEIELLYEGTSRTEIVPVMIKGEVVEEQLSESPEKSRYVLIGAIALGVLIVLTDVIFVLYYRKRRHKELKEFKQQLDREI